jgi:hypothetical protein
LEIPRGYNDNFTTSIALLDNIPKHSDHFSVSAKNKNYSDERKPLLQFTWLKGYDSFENYGLL